MIEVHSIELEILFLLGNRQLYTGTQKYLQVSNQQSQ